LIVGLLGYCAGVDDVNICGLAEGDDFMSLESEFGFEGSGITLIGLAA
jgi:hypothetical protein